MQGKLLYETHMHTSQGSACAHSTGEEMARAYHERGYTGIIVTDHFFNGNSAVPKDLPWTERVERFLKGYEQAKATGETIGLQVFFGWEYADRGPEFLTYGLGKDFLLAHPDMLSWPIEGYFRAVKEAGGFLVQAHPYRRAPYIREVRTYEKLVDGFEVQNIGNSDVAFDLEALRTARENGLYETAGSDEHDHRRFRGGGMAFHRRLADIQDFILAVQDRDWEYVLPFGEKHPY